MPSSALRPVGGSEALHPRADLRHRGSVSFRPAFILSLYRPILGRPLPHRSPSAARAEVVEALLALR